MQATNRVKFSQTSRFKISNTDKKTSTNHKLIFYLHSLVDRLTKYRFDYDSCALMNGGERMMLSRDVSHRDLDNVRTGVRWRRSECTVASGGDSGSSIVTFWLLCSVVPKAACLLAAAEVLIV